MAEDDNRSQKQRQRGTFFERLVRKTLESVGGVFEKPFHAEDENRLPATSDLTERLKRLIDSGVREQKDGGRVAPHLIRLKYTWGETTEEFEQNLERLKNELLVVAIDHINDNRYRTVAPVKLEVKPDILSEGFTLAVGFDASHIAEAEKVEIPAEIFAGLLPPENKTEIQKPNEIEVSVAVELPGGTNRAVKLFFAPNGKSNLTVGRSRENDLFLDDRSVSKLHASLVMNDEGKLRVADVGSTNGTYLEKERISYGKAYEIEPGEPVAFGEVKCRFDWNFEAATVESKIENDSPEHSPFGGEEPEAVLSNAKETAASDASEVVAKSSGEPGALTGNKKNDLEN